MKSYGNVAGKAFYFAVATALNALLIFINAVLLFLIITFSCASIVHASEFYATGSVGASIITKLPPDGTWHQDGLPNEMSRSGLAFKGGLGYRFSERWFIEGNYLHLGKFDTTATWVPDEDYDPTNHVATTTYHQYTGVLNSSIQGGELVLGYQYPLIQDLLYVRGKAGIWGGKHTIEWSTFIPWEQNRSGHFTGLQLGPTVGAGLCVGKSLQLCGDVSYYYGIASTKYPVAHEIVLPTLTINVPVW